jgi:hypothetical protein
MIEIEKLNKTKAFESIKNVKTQVDFYIENGSHPDIIKMVALGNKSFGEKMQRIVMECLNLDRPTSTGHDVQQSSTGKKFEVKSSRFWVSNGDWKWQHIMEDHDYDYLLLCGVNFNSVDVFIISKSDLLSLKDKGLVTQQGGAEGQGLWCNYNNIKNYLTPIKNLEDLDNYLK